MAKPPDTPSDVTADQGEVLVDGPDGVGYAMTPDAAAKTSARLLVEAARARGQASRDDAVRDGHAD